MVENNLKSHKIELTKSQLKTFRSAHSSYKIHLEQEKKKISLSEHKKQALYISDDINKLKLQIKQKEKAGKVMGDEFLESVRLSTKKNYMSFVIKGNALKKKLDKTKEDVVSHLAIV